MIEYDYKIVRDEKDKTRTFVPDKIPTQLDNLVRIEGPNDSGKSTLLHIIALSMYGLHNKTIHPSLIHKMQNLLDPHQKLTFSVRITDRLGKTCIISEKTDPDRPEINVRKLIGGKMVPIIPERLEDQFCLIYDIPSDPTERLYELINDIKNQQKEYSQRISNLRNTIRTTITEIMNSQNPKRLSELELEFNELTKDKEKLTEARQSTKILLETLQDSVSYYYFNHYRQILDEDRKRLDELTMKLNKEKRTKRQESKAFADLRQLISIELMEISKLHSSISELLEKILPQENSNLRKWSEKQLLTGAVDDVSIEQMKGEIREFLVLLAEIQTQQSDDTRINSMRLYEQLISLLSDYKGLDILLPGTQKSLTELIEELEKALKKNQPLLILSKNVNNSIPKLRDLDSKLDNLAVLTEKLKQHRKSTDDTNVESNLVQFENPESSILENKIKSEEASFSFYQRKYIERNRPSVDKVVKIGEGKLKDYEGYTEEQLRKELDYLETREIHENDLLEHNKDRMERCRFEIDSLKSKEPHRYQKYYGKLNEMLEATGRLERKIQTDFGRYVNAITSEKKEAENKEQESYNQAVFRYLARQVKSIQYVDNTYDLQTIDMAHGIALTKSGKEIRLADLGTGRSQSAYLQAKLNSHDSRTIVALFDEIAMMDEKSLEPLYNRFQELYDKGELLVGVVAQKGEGQLKITSFVKR